MAKKPSRPLNRTGSTMVAAIYLASIRRTADRLQAATAAMLSVRDLADAGLQSATAETELWWKRNGYDAIAPNIDALAKLVGDLDAAHGYLLQMCPPLAKATAQLDARRNGGAS